MILYKIDVEAIAQSLTVPFRMEHIAPVDHFAVYLYLCEGVVARHRHPMQDELFYVHRGLVSLATDWGHVDLLQRELAVVPRGVSHVSGSVEPSIVMLFQAHSEPDRKNGHGRLTAKDYAGALPKWSVGREATRLTQPNIPKPLVEVDEMSLRVVSIQGATSWHAHPEHEEMLFVMEGRLEVGTELGPLTLCANELMVIPQGRIHRLVSREGAVVVSLIHGEVNPLQHMGY